jgi:hypothetical protein
MASRNQQRRVARTVLTILFSFLGTMVCGESRVSHPTVLHSQCADRIDIQAALQKLASGEEGEGERAKEALYYYAIKAPACRKAIIQQVMAAMDKPHLDFDTDDSTYYLWREGAVLLGDLRATEALDLLISHLDLTYGVSYTASMNHQPAIVGVMGFGPRAVPKLSWALRHNTNRDIRLAAAYCLSSIRGNDAIGALKLALRVESDPCVRRFLRLALDLHAKELKVARGSASPSERDALKKLQIDRMLGLSCR